MGSVKKVFKNATNFVEGLWDAGEGIVKTLTGQNVPDIDIPENKGIALDNISSGETGATVLLGGRDDERKARASGRGSGSRSSSGVSGSSSGGLKL